MANGDFPYWESDRTQPAGATESDTRPQQLEALQSYLNQRVQPQPSNFIPYQQPLEPPQQAPRQQVTVAENPTISITAGKTRIDITITPL